MSDLKKYTEDELEDLYDENLEIMVADFQNATLAFQTQDSQAIGMLLVKSKGVYEKTVSVCGQSPETDVMQIFLNFIEISGLLIKMSQLLMEGRIDSVETTVNKAEYLIEETAVLYNRITDEIDEELFEVISIFIGSLNIYSTLNSVCKIDFDACKSRLEGKYVEYIEVFDRKIKFLKNVKLDLHSDACINDLNIGMISFLDRLGDTLQVQKEKYIEVNKTIQFLPPIGRDVFIVHGHNTGVLVELKDILENDFNVHPIILKDEPDKGKTIIEKFEDCARQCVLALVVVTCDDFVVKSNTEYFQGRPNVLFELGWFCGRFGRNSVRILSQNGSKLPSDLDGIITISFENSITETLDDLKREFIHLGVINKSC